MEAKIYFMNEYMFLVRNLINSKDLFTAGEHLAFVNACKAYINGLMDAGKLIAAQPLIREGCIISCTNGEWQEQAIPGSGVVQVGYYHIRACILAEAVQIAKANPEFLFTNTASIEVRPLKIMEEQNDFKYPSS